MMQGFGRDVQDHQQPILPVVQHLCLHQGRWAQLEAGAPGLHVTPNDCVLQKGPKEDQGNVAIERVKSIVVNFDVAMWKAVRSCFLR